MTGHYLHEQRIAQLQTQLAAKDAEIAQLRKVIETVEEERWGFRRTLERIRDYDYGTALWSIHEIVTAALKEAE